MGRGTGAGTPGMETEPQGTGTHRAPLRAREGWLLAQIIIFFASIVIDF